MSYDSKRYALVNRWDPRHLLTVDRLLGPKPGERVLEVGCGRGHLTKRLRDKGVEAVGIDANPQASEHAVTDGVITMDAAHLEFETDAFDKIVSVHAIEHIPPIESAFGEMARVLKPGGTALYIYPAEPVKGIWAIPTAVILHNNPLKATTVHCNWLWPRRVRAIAEPLGFDELHHEFNLLSSPQFVSLFRLA
ncbi:MAG: methyltransferase domain-containing protein [Acidimicrobiia bacterium]|nr:methyltransferase domain-containing protein [Acidimicrobiia bacterium]